MNQVTQSLSEEDVHQLLNNPSSETKIKVAEKVLDSYEKELLTPSEIAIAEQIFRFLVKDVEIKVRKVLSEQLKDSPHAPHDIILSLAKDIDEIALPILENSHLLSDTDLIEIIERAERTSPQVAIAKRKSLSSKVSDALIDTENALVVEHLLKNQEASIEDASFFKIVNYFPNNEMLMDSILNHRAVAITAVEKLLSKVSEDIRRHLEKKYANTNTRLSAVIDKTRELATLRLLVSSTEDKILQDTVDHLHALGKLTPSIVITSLCLGNMRFFEISIAKLAHIPISNAVALLNDKGNLGFESLYKQTNLPESLLMAVKLLLKVVTEIREKEPRPEYHDLNSYLNRMIERLLLHSAQQEVENLSYIIAIIRQNAFLIKQ